MPPVFPGGIDAKAIAVGKTEHCDGYLRRHGRSRQEPARGEQGRFGPWPAGVTDARAGAYMLLRPASGATSTPANRPAC